jgi:hypothetical protein
MIWVNKLMACKCSIQIVWFNKFAKSLSTFRVLWLTNLWKTPVFQLG